MEYIYVALGTFLFYTIRYYLMAGAFYLVAYKWFKQQLLPFKINKKFPEKDIIMHEWKWGSTVGLVYMPWAMVMYWQYTNGYTQIYHDINEFGLIYLGVSIFLLFFIQDTYFFWTHYGIHKVNFLRKIGNHHIHHKSHNPTPWSAFSVHPGESFLELAYRPLIIMILPLHPIAIAAYLIGSFVLNVVGHSGYEFFPSGYTTNPLTKFNGSSTHHYLHHINGNYNFSLYFCWWDKVMGTEHPEFTKTFEQTAQNNPIKLPELDISGMIGGRNET